MTKLFLPLHVRTKDNLRGHWSKKAKVIQVERHAAFYAVKAADTPPFPVKVTLTRCGPRKLDTWNLGSAFKGVIDGIADAYGVDDGHSDWQFIFEQRKQSLYGVEIRIEEI